MRVPWTARISNQSILKEINPEYSLEGLKLKMKCPYFGQLQSICCFTGPRAGQASGTHQMCGAHSQGGAGSDRSPCPRWHLRGSCPGCRISLARCVHRPDGVGWDGFPPLCSSLQPGAVDLGSQEQPELRVLFPLPLSVSPSPSLSFCLVSLSWA